jgi:hypothetical protein
MREKCHKGLTKLVFKKGRYHFPKNVLSLLLKASIEPDQEYRQTIERNLDDPLKVLPILSKWLSEHTIGARKLALLNLKKAYYARLKGDPSWVYFLGLASHYIIDWGTPYHSPVTIAKKVIPLTILGGLGSAFLKYMINLMDEDMETQEGVSQWGLFGASAVSGFSLLNQYFKHNNFEKRCDELWEQYEHLININYDFPYINHQLSNNFKDAMATFDRKMEELRYVCENTTPDWILSDNGKNFMDYMIQIAIVMEYACKIILHY